MLLKMQTSFYAAMIGTGCRTVLGTKSRPIHLVNRVRIYLCIYLCIRFRGECADSAMRIARVNIAPKTLTRNRSRFAAGVKLSSRSSGDPRAERAEATWLLQGCRRCIPRVEEISAVETERRTRSRFENDAGFRRVGIFRRLARAET